MSTGDDLLDTLDRWEASGGHWRVLSERPGQLVFGLFTCDGGEQMSQVTGARTPALETFLAGRVRSDS